MESGLRVVRGCAPPGPHLTWEALRCHDATKTPYPLDYRADRLPILVGEFEAVRAALKARCGHEVALVVQSAYRTEAHNRRIGGAADSQHVHGRALDLRPESPEHLSDLRECVLQVAKSRKVIRGVGWYPAREDRRGFVHMDVRPSATGRMTTWEG